MEHFLMNGYFWWVKYVDPESGYLVDRTGKHRLATTDPRTHCIYLSNTLQGEMLNRVLTHELAHCAMFSYGLLPDIRQAIRPEYWIDAEEWVCNFIADYGRKIFSTVYDVLGDEAWMVIPYELERLVG